MDVEEVAPEADERSVARASEGMAESAREPVGSDETGEIPTFLLNLSASAPDVCT